MTYDVVGFPTVMSLDSGLSETDGRMSGPPHFLTNVTDKVEYRDDLRTWAEISILKDQKDPRRAVVFRR